MLLFSKILLAISLLGAAPGSDPGEDGVQQEEPQKMAQVQVKYPGDSKNAEENKKIQADIVEYVEPTYKVHLTFVVVAPKNLVKVTSQDPAVPTEEIAIFVESILGEVGCGPGKDGESENEG